MTSQKAEKMIAHASHADIPDDITRLIFKNNINAEWIDSLKENHQTDCEEYKDFEKTLTPDTIRHALRHQYSNPSAERIYEKKRNMLRVKELEIVMKNVKRLKLFMNEYKNDPILLTKIKKKLRSIIMTNYGRSGHGFHFHNGAHPEWIMNAFIYNRSQTENRFKVLRVDGNQVTYQPYQYNEPVGEPIKIGLDEFLKIRISAQDNYNRWKDIPIGEVYRIFPERDDEFDTDESYNANVDDYLAHLMSTFAKKPDTEFFSVPIEAAVPASPASGAAASSDAGGSRKNMKSTRKQRMYKKSRKCRKSKKSKKH